ncbi:MAG: hypothetical protein U0L79_05740 [Lachnospiraceae bacterium]|nr:hypothetical protein [Lachnospiraceae bacterium]
MADEISQVVELECRGVYYLVKGTKEMIAMVAKFIVKMGDWSYQKYLKAPGNISWDKLQKVSEGAPPLLEFPKEMFEPTVRIGDEMISPFEYYCSEHKLRYCIMPDLNPNDDYIPVAVCAQDMGVHQEQIKSFMNARISREEDKEKDYDAKIAELKEKIESAESEEEKAEAEKELAALEEARGQNHELLEESQQKLNNDNIIEFAEYLKQGQGTVLEKDMDEAFEQMQTCSLVKEFMPYECMYPIRDEGLVPDSGEIYYSQVAEDDTVYTIKRDFSVDEQGIVYSTYHVTSGDNAEKEIVFSDKGFTEETWKEQLPNLLKESGMVADAPTTAIHGKERMVAYLDVLERNFKSAREQSGEEKGKDEEVVASSKEAEEFIKDAKERRDLREGYERAQYTTIVVPATAIMPSGEMIISLELAEGLVEGITVEKMDSETAVVSLKEDAVYRMERPDGSYKELKGADVIEEMNVKSEGVQARAAARGRK